MAATVALTTCLTFFVNQGKDDILRARSTLLIDFQQPATSTVATLAPQLQEGYLATQTEIISSPKVAQNVINRMNLIKGEEYWDQFNEDTNTVDELISFAIEQVKKLMNADIENAEIEDTEAAAELADDPETTPQNDFLIYKILDQLRVKPRESTRLIDLVYVSRDADFAIEMANAFADAYVKTNLELNTLSARRNAEWMNDQLLEFRAKLDAAQRRLTDYEMKTGILADDGRMGIELTHLSELTEQLAIAEAEAEFEENKLAQLIEIKETGADLNSILEVMTNSVLQRMKFELRAKEGELTELSVALGQNHPDYKRVAAEIASMKTMIESEIELIIEGIRNQASLASAKVEALRKAQTIQKNKLLQGKETSSDLPALVREIENAQTSYELALQRYEEYNLQSRITQTNATVLNYAEFANRARIPTMTRNLTLSVILGFILGCAMLLLLERRRPLVRDEKDVMELDLDYLGRI